MITLEEAIIMGVNAPRPHQRVISKLNTEFGMLYYKQAAILLEPFPEMMLDDDKTSPTPDISLYDNVLENTPVIIEVTRTGMVQTDLKKVCALINSQDYGIQEGFVYDYKLNEWHKYKLGVGNITDKPSFCEAINLDLATLL
jgi:Uma2 family endonuclease